MLGMEIIDVLLGMCGSKPIAVMTSQMGPSSLISLSGLFPPADSQLGINDFM